MIKIIREFTDWVDTKYEMFISVKKTNSGLLGLIQGYDRYASQVIEALVQLSEDETCHSINRFISERYPQPIFLAIQGLSTD